MSVVQQTPVEEPKKAESLPEAGEKGIASGVNTYVPHTVFTVGQAGSVQMSPFHPQSLDGELQQTHNEIIKLQNSMIEQKKKKLLEKSASSSTAGMISSSLDDDGDFVDFGLVGLHE